MNPCTRSASFRNHAIASVLALSSATAAGEDYSITLSPKPDEQRLFVEIVWGTKDRLESVLEIPQRFGNCDDVPSLIQHIAFDPRSSATRDGRRWRIKHPRNHSIECRYEIKCESAVERNHHFRPAITADFAHFIGNTMLLAPFEPAGSKKTYDVTLRWRLPKGWRAVCSWGDGAHVGAPIRPNDLQHSVYLAGRLKTLTTQVGRAAQKATASEHASADKPSATSRPTDVGTRESVTVALAGRFQFTVEQLTALVSDIVAHQRAFMGDDQFPPFLVTVIPYGEADTGVSSQSGTGLYQSFAAFMTPNSQMNDALEHLLAHEMFHYWNGRVLDRESPEELVYWFSEGFTDYYSMRILFESGRWDAATFCKWVNRHLADYVRNPARNATNEQIKDGYWTQRDTVGEVAYQRGMALALRWNRLARDAGVTNGVDRLFLALVERARTTDFRLSNTKIRAIGAELLGPWFKEDFDRFVERAEQVEMPLEALKDLTVPGGGEIVGAETTVYKLEVGFDAVKSTTDGRVQGLRANSNAEKAGLRDGDELVGWSMTGDPDHKVELSVKRDGKVRKISYFPRGESTRAVQFKVRTR